MFSGETNQARKNKKTAERWEIQCRSRGCFWVSRICGGCNETSELPGVEMCHPVSGCLVSATGPPKAEDPREQSIAMLSNQLDLLVWSENVTKR